MTTTRLPRPSYFPDARCNHARLRQVSADYDGRSFTATGSPVTSGATYKFGIDSVPGLAGSIKGSFYGPLAAETGGNFNFHTTAGPTYLTSGIFAAKR